MEEQTFTNSKSILSNNKTNEKFSVEEKENVVAKKCNHQLIHLIGKLIAKVPFVPKKEMGEDSSLHKGGTCSSVSLLTIKSGDKKTKIVTKVRQPDEPIDRWQRKKLESIVNNTHLSMIKGHQPKDYSLTTQENIGETFWDYKQQHDLTSVRRIYIFTKLNGMLKVDDLLSPLRRWCKNHGHEDVADNTKSKEMIKAFAEYIETLAFERDNKTNGLTNRALLFQKIICGVYYDHTLLNLQDRKSNNVCLSSPIYDNDNNVLPNLPEEMFVDIDTEDINGFKFMFDYSFFPEEEQKRMDIVALWMEYLKKMIYRFDYNVRSGYYKRRLCLKPEDLVENIVKNFIMCGFDDKNKLTGYIYNHLARAIAYWKKLLRDKNFDDPECRKLTKLAIKNFQRCINKYWTELTKTTIFFGKKFEESIEKNKQENEQSLKVAMDMLAHCDAWGIDIQMEK